jgi:hypothetical protein
VEYIARTDLKTLLLQNQSVLQRGFTENTSPTNAALIVEELYREFEDKNKPFYLVLLDAKSAFDNKPVLMTSGISLLLNI